MARELRIGFVGAGAVNFGGGEGPWDHATRLEKIGGVRVVGVADCSPERARAQLARRGGPMYEEARVFGSHADMLRECRPDAVWIGVPPNVHGTAEPGKDIELACVEAGVHMFVEKPLSCARPELVRPVADAVMKAGIVTSVGYMFRYARAIDAMKAAVDAAPGGVKAFIGRYNCAYSEIRKAEWWDVRASGGPIVEQATHFVDLARYIAGEAVVPTVRALAIAGSAPAGELLDVPRKPDGSRYDAGVADEHRHARATAAVWQFESGALGSLTHGTLLHREKYETEIEVWGDGLRLVLQDPYGACRLLIRRPHSEETEEISFAGDDPYLAENAAFIEAIRSGDRRRVRSSYADALRTYELTWAITDAAAS